MRRLLPVAALASLGLLACGEEFSPDLEYWVDDPSANVVPGGRPGDLPPNTEWFQSSLSVEDGRLQGVIGQFRQLDHTATLTRAYRTNDTAYIEINVQDRNQAAMAGIQIFGQLDELRPGTRLEFDRNGAANADQELFVAMWGCEGPEIGRWSYDQPANKVELEVFEMPGDGDILLIEFEAELPSYDGSPEDPDTPNPSIVTGEFTVDTGSGGDIADP